MSKEYEITTAVDFLTVPAEKLDECLADFKIWIESCRAIGDVIGVEFIVNRFVWIDDGVLGISSVEILVEKRNDDDQ